MFAQQNFGGCAATGPVRGYVKLFDAAHAFDFDFKDKVVLDIGSSTGGFTEYALEHGAKKVIAVEKGTDQMREPTRSNPKVELHEKTDIFEVVAGVGKQDHSEKRHSDRTLAPDVILADVSFIPLTKVLKHAKMNLARSDTDFLVMLKPQFETTNPADLTSGIVKNATIRRKIIKNFEQWLKANGFLIVKKRDNRLQGKHGNIERFYWLQQEKK